MKLEMPYIEIAKDAKAGKHVVVFCDNATQANRTQDNVFWLIKQMDDNAVNHPRYRRINVGDGEVSFFLLNGYDGRGYDADVVYLSESARRQYEYASIVNAEVK
jgi:hypothetical protein